MGMSGGYWEGVAPAVLSPELRCVQMHHGIAPRDLCIASLKATGLLHCLLQDPSRAAKTVAKVTNEVRCKANTAPFHGAYLGLTGRLTYWRKMDPEPHTRAFTSPVVPFVAPKSVSEDALKAIPQAARHHRPSGVLIVGTMNAVHLIDTMKGLRGDSIAKKVIKAAPGHGHSAAIAAVDADFTRIYSTSYDTTVRVWGRSSGKLIMNIKPHKDPVTHLLVDQLAECSARIVTASLGRSLGIFLHEFGESGVTSKKMQAHGSRLCGLIHVGEGGVCFGAGVENKVMVWDSRVGVQAVQSAVVMPGFLSAMHSRGEAVYVAGGESSPTVAGIDIRSFSSEKPHVFERKSLHAKPITALHAHTAADAASQTRTVLFSSSRDGFLKLTDTSARADTPPVELLGGAGRGGLHSMEWCGTSLLLVRCQTLQAIDFSGRGHARKSGTV